MKKKVWFRWMVLALVCVFWAGAAAGCSPKQAPPENPFLTAENGSYQFNGIDWSMDRYDVMEKRGITPQNAVIFEEDCLSVPFDTGLEHVQEARATYIFISKEYPICTGRIGIRMEGNPAENWKTVTGKVKEQAGSDPQLTGELEMSWTGSDGSTVLVTRDSPASELIVIQVGRPPVPGLEYHTENGEITPTIDGKPITPELLDELYGKK